MKNLKLTVLVAALIAISATAAAKSDATIGSAYVSYSPMSFYDNGYLIPELGTDRKQFTAFTAGINNAHILSREVPFFLEYGLAGQYSYCNKNDKVSYIRMVSAKVPLSLGFVFDWDPITLAPYAGVDGIGYIWGTASSVDLFSNDGLGLNRFGINWHAGAKLFIGEFLIGVAYEGAVSSLYRNETLGTNVTARQVNISLGFKF